jgi:DNA-binding winged helix-turn-helix (wHTH) protein/TolB-like protein
MSAKPKLFYEFGPFRVDDAEQQLLRDGEEIELTPKAFGVLLVLVRNQGHVVGKEDFMREVWPDSVVEDKNITDNISILRQALGDDAREPRYIKTVQRKGYRFVCEVTEVQDEEFDLVVAERTRAHVIVEEHEARPTDIPAISGRTNAGHLLTAQAAPTGMARRRLRPWAIAVGCVLLLGGVVVAAYVWKSRADRAVGQTTSVVQSIAVLPFKPLVPEGSDPALEIGMTDALITKLSNIRQVVVRPTSAVLKYNDPAQDPLAAGREQGVDVLLDGKVQRAGDRVRVTVQLVRVSDGVPLWGREFDESLTNIFAVQDSISEQVTRALTLRLSSDEQKRLTNRYTESVEAYQLYLQGRLFQSKRTVADVRSAIGYFQQAIALDQNYAPAYSGLADSYHLLAFYGALSPQEAYPQAKKAALKALEIDPDRAEAYTSLARIKSAYDRDARGAEEDFRRAIEINPNYAPAHHWYSRHLLYLGRVDEAVLEARKAQELDPLSLIINGSLAEILYCARRFDDALKYLRRVREVDPSFQKAFIATYLYLTYMRKGMYEEAILENAKRLSDGAGAGKEAGAAAALRAAYATGGERGVWQKQIELAEKLKKGDRDFPLFMAEAYTRLGENDQAFVWLNKAVAEKHQAVWSIPIDPDFDSLHSDPRFAELVRRVGSAQ